MAPQDPKHKFQSTVAYIAIGLILSAILYGDFITPLGIAVWVLYMVPLSMSVLVWNPAAPIILGILISGCMTMNFLLDTTAVVSRTLAMTNRGIGLVVVWSIALMCYLFIKNKLSIRRQEWLQQGQVQLSAALAGDQSIKRLGENALTFMSEYLGAQVGAFYVQNGKGYRCKATYGVPAEGVAAVITEDDGLAGQAIRDRKIFRLNDIPSDYFTYGSAFGQTTPKHILIAPAIIDGHANAVIELGFADDIPERTFPMLERVSETLGVAVRSADYRSHLQNLLEETQRQSEELQAQSEELRVSNEELEEQSRTLQESQQRMEQQQAEMEQTNAQLEEQTQILESQRDDLARAQSALQLRSRELEQASQYKTDFLANMSHELRTPLNSSLILAKLLADNTDGNLSEEQVRFAETIQSAGNDLLNLINDILDLSKIEAGHMDIQPESVRLSKLADDLNRTFEPMAQEKKLKFAISVGDNCPDVIETDGKRLEQILKNLLSNAVKFTEKGEVRLAVARTGKTGIAFSVTDTGIGIAKEQQDVIFEAFRQADGTTNRKYGGTGLGLSISRELVRLLGGDISLNSTPKKGSTFTVTLPQRYSPDKVQPRAIASPPPAILQDDTSPAPARHQHSIDIADDRDTLDRTRKTLLVVEDDESFARILYNMAHDLDFQCILAHSADEALIVATQYMPNAVVLDVGLPDHSGLSVLDRLKQNPRTRHIPVHVISADDYSQTAYSLGAAGYMLKPVKREQLANSLQQLEGRLEQRVRRVLIVEDDKVQRESVQKLLSAHDVETVGVGTAADCLEQLKQNRFDCVVLDLSLPDASGYSLLESMSHEEAFAIPPVIVYTGRDLSTKEEEDLRKYSRSIIIKGAKSPERLLDEVTLFLHQVVADLPAEQQKMLKKAKNRDAVLEKRHILVVEDDIRNVYSLTNILEPRGAVVQIARNGIEALEALSNAGNNNNPPIDLVLMDVMMPEMDGLTATREIRKRREWNKLPIIMLTAKAMKGDQERCIEAGANDYMAKPLDVDKLLSLVRVWMPR
jgi:signal transduction histidine kinase/CheY-like chemotaxis protein